MGHLHFHRRGQGSGRFEPDPGTVGRWIDQLPLGNTGETSRRLFEALVQLANTPLSPRKRQVILDRLAPVVADCVASLQARYRGKAFPLAPHNQRVAELTRALWYQMARGCRQVALDLGQGRLHRRDAEPLGRAVHGALGYLGLVLLNTYQVYLPCPKGTWQRIYGLHRLAQQKGVADLPIGDPLPPLAAHRISGLFRQILLLALAGSYRLQPAETGRVYRNLATWAPAAELRAVPQGDIDGPFVVPLETDDPPGYPAILRHPEDGERLILDPRPMTDRVLEARRSAAGNDIEALDPSTVRRLLLGWGAMPARRPRRRGTADSRVVIGLSALHHHLGGETLLQGIQHGSAGQQPAFDDGIRETADVWMLAGIPGDREDTRIPPGEVMEFTLTDEPEPPARVPYPLRRWETLNTSDAGCCLLWLGQETDLARVGDLVGIQPADAPPGAELRVGIIRWLKCRTGHGMELGVERLAQRVRPVLVRPEQGDEPLPDFSPALMLDPPASGEPQSPVLITPSLPAYRIGRRLLMVEEGNELPVRLTRLVENTGLLFQFRFEATGEAPVRSPAATDIPEDPRAFARLWEEL